VVPAQGRRSAMRLTGRAIRQTGSVMALEPKN